MRDNHDKTLAEILAKIEAERPEFERIMEERKSPLATGRKKKLIHQIPSDLDFAIKDGNTVYEVIGHFNPEAEESIVDRIICCLGYSFMDAD